MRARGAAVFGCFAGLLAGLGAGAAGRTGDDPRTGRVGGPGAGSSTGDAFSLEGGVAPRQSPRGGSFVLEVAGGPGDGPQGATPGCLCFDLIFADGFESGGTGAWDVP